MAQANWVSALCVVSVQRVSFSVGYGSQVALGWGVFVGGSACWSRLRWIRPDVFLFVAGGAGCNRLLGGTYVGIE